MSVGVGVDLCLFFWSLFDLNTLQLEVSFNFSKKYTPVNGIYSWIKHDDIK